jgi:hypothetical protein
VLQEVRVDILWRVDGFDLDGKRLQAIVSADDDEILIKVVTTF